MCPQRIRFFLGHFYLRRWDHYIVWDNGHQLPGSAMQYPRRTATWATLLQKPTNPQPWKYSLHSHVHYMSCIIQLVEFARHEVCMVVAMKITVSWMNLLHLGGLIRCGYFLSYKWDCKTNNFYKLICCLQEFYLTENEKVFSSIQWY